MSSMDATAGGSALGPIPPRQRAGAVPPVRHINPLAITSLVLGLIWFYGLGSLLAVIFGHLARHQVRVSGGAQSGGGMALAGLILGYVGIGLFIALVVVMTVVVATSVPHNPAF